MKYTQILFAVFLDGYCICGGLICGYSVVWLYDAIDDALVDPYILLPVEQIKHMMQQAYACCIFFTKDCRMFLPSRKIQTIILKITQL